MKPVNYVGNLDLLPRWVKKQTFFVGEMAMMYSLYSKEKRNKRSEMSKMRVLLGKASFGDLSSRTEEM